MFFQGNEKYNCATYLRLSRSDGDQQESNSIKNQRALLNDYMGKHPELHKFDEYVDDGYSGTNFERPDFKRMMQDIEKRNVNCIIVKDLSRFGRNYIETGRYLERIFPFMGVRFIAINDHYDSAEENDDKGRILIPFNNLMFLLVFVTSMILFRTLLNRNLWLNPLSNVMGGWGIWETMNGEQKLTTECIENVIMMVPFTSMVIWTFQEKVGSSWKKILWYSGKIAFIFSISIEMLQLFLRLGTFQLSDLFYNTVGGVVGGLVYYGIVKARKHL